MKTPTGNNRSPYNNLHVVFASFYPTILFLRDHIVKEATLLFCVIPTIAPYIEYIKIPVEKFHLLIYVNYKTFAKAIL